MISFLKLIRWPNLLLLALMQILVRTALMSPILSLEGKGVLLTPLEFSLMALACLCIAAGGYIINDIEDVAIDTINRPAKIIVGVVFTKETAFNYYLYLTALGILLGGYLSFVKEYKQIFWINTVSAGLLYFYATTYKCVPVLGNIIVSFLTALAVILVIIPEPLAIKDAPILTLIAAYAAYAFTISMIREMIKDLEDKEGDAACGCKSLPVLYGNRVAKMAIILLTALLASTLILIQVHTAQWNAPLPFYYLITFVELPLVILIVQLIRSKERSDFTHASRLAKFIMFTGVFSMCIFHLSFQ